MCFINNQLKLRFIFIYIRYNYITTVYIIVSPNVLYVLVIYVFKLGNTKYN